MGTVFESFQKFSRRYSMLRSWCSVNMWNSSLVIQSFMRYEKRKTNSALNSLSRGSRGAVNITSTADAYWQTRYARYGCNEWCMVNRTWSAQWNTTYFFTFHMPKFLVYIIVISWFSASPFWKKNYSTKFWSCTSGGCPILPPKAPHFAWSLSTSDLRRAGTKCPYELVLCPSSSNLPDSSRAH